VGPTEQPATLPDFGRDRVDSFVGVAVGGDIVEKAVGRGEIMLGGGRLILIGGELTDSSEDGKVQGSRIEE
jgi:hypothetical protein